MKALLIIDMQKVAFTANASRYKAKEVIDKINKLSNEFRSNGYLVIFIQHDGSKENFCFPNTEEWEILSELNVELSDYKISKTANDSFYQTDLEILLNRFKVEDIVVTGCATDFCVDATIKSALTKDYKITVLSDCHTVSDRPNLKAIDIINYYNWMWSEMIPTKNMIHVTDLNSFLLD